MSDIEPRLPNPEQHFCTTNDASSDAPRSFWRKLVRNSIKVDAVANAASVVVDLRDEEQGLELPARLFEQLPFAIYVCDRDGLATPPTHRGFGTRVMENMIGQLRGEVRFDWRDQGLTCEIALPLA